MTLSDCISTATYLLGGRKELVLGERQKCKGFHANDNAILYLGLLSKLGYH
jgi:hypothetical protein